jgi:hypothetical protein
MSLQRSLQKGRWGDAADHSMGLPQVGHLTIGALTALRLEAVRYSS